MNLAQGKKMREISQQELKEFLHYDPMTGIFTRAKKVAATKIGDIAGYKNKDGYIEIRLNNILYKAHRLAWLYVTGKMPKDIIDHKNGITCDNWFDNLREVTNQQNGQNQIKPSKNNTSGFLGVVSNKKGGFFHAQIKSNGKARYLGRFDTAEEAHQAYLAAKRELHPFSTL